MDKKMTGLSSSTLKWIAVITMLIDHFAVAIYLRLPGWTANTYYVLRYIGRIAFPIYCFLIVEGFFHTRNIWKYIGRCFLFALISEVPFDMAIWGHIWYIDNQNVYFTLTIGLCTIFAMDTIKKKVKDIRLCAVLIVICILAGAGIAQLMQVDYHYLGVIFIVVFYLCHDMNPWYRDIIGACMFAYEKTAPLAFIPIHLYNGKRGMKLKYFFYLVYPVHLLIYGIIRLYVLK